MADKNEFQNAGDYTLDGVLIVGSSGEKINVHSQTHLVFDDLHGSVTPHIDDPKVLTVKVNSGTVEMKDNKVIILAD